MCSGPANGGPPLFRMIHFIQNIHRELQGTRAPSALTRCAGPVNNRPGLPPSYAGPVSFFGMPSPVADCPGAAPKSPGSFTCGGGGGFGGY